MITHSSIERLESRIAPAALMIKLAGGTLTLAGDSASDAVHLEQTASSIEVFDGVLSLGTFAGVRSISAKLQGKTDVAVNLAGAGITGALSVSVTGLSSLSVGAGSHIGDVLAYTGDTAARTLTLGENVLVGKNLTFTGGPGADAFTIGKGTTIGGNASFASVETGLFDDSTVITIKGGLTFKNGATTLSVDLKTNKSQGVNVARAFSYTGGHGNDSVALGGTIGGNATFTDKTGNNSLSFAAGTVIHGAVTMTTGSGDDSFGIRSGTVDKDLNLKLGDGTNSFNYGTAAAAGAAAAGVSAIGNVVNIGGNFLLTTGEGNDTWTGTGGVLNVAKNLTAHLGNGTNTINAAVAVLGTKVSVSTGSGVDTVTLSGDATNADLTVSLGADDDDFTSTLTGVHSASYDGGSGFDHFRPNLLSGDPVTLVGFEDFS